MKTHNFAILTSLILLLPVFHNCAAQDPNWISLFDGETLDGWSIHSGFATYRVEDGAIVGQAVKGSPNTFLCTNQEYGDFIRTIVNGIVITDFRDGLTLRGIIGLQVHDVGRDSTPYQVRWKNIRILPLD